MKPVVLTHHAETKIAERGLQLIWVEQTAREPDWTEPEPDDPQAERRFRAVAAREGRVLRAVCVETKNTIRIITAMFDRGARRKP